METYVNIINRIFNICGQEFVTQLLMVYLIFLVLPKRKLFPLRYILSFAAMAGLGWLEIFLAIEYKLTVVPWNYLLFFVLSVLALWFSFKLSFIQATFIGLINYCVQHLISTISYSLCFFVVFKFELNQYYFFIYDIIMPIITISFCLILYFFMARAVKKNKSLEFNSVIVIVSGTVFLAVAVLLSYYALGGMPVFVWEENIYIRLMSALCTILVMIVLYLNVQRTSVKNENKILQLLLDKDKQQYRAAKLSNEKIQIKYHDILQRKQQEMVDYEELDEIEENKDVLFNTFFTGNRALDIILGEKASESHKAGIRFICVADGTALDFMKSYHIYSLVGNAVQNAIESLKKCDNQKAMEIETTIVKKQNHCIIKVSNYAEGVIMDKNGRPVTTKEDKENHGYGIKSMINVVDRYNGEIGFSFENNQFEVDIMIPIPEKQ